MDLTIVASLAEAWIETLDINSQWRILSVASLAEAWIETFVEIIHNLDE